MPNAMDTPSRLPSVRRPAGLTGGRSRPMSMFEGPMLNLNLNQPPANGTTSKQTKRRSLLPQFTRKTVFEEPQPQEEIKEVDEGDIGNDPGRAIADVQGAVEDPDRRIMPPPASKLGRPMSVYGMAGVGKMQTGVMHSRGFSKDTIPSNRVPARDESLAKLTGLAPLAPSAIPEQRIKHTSVNENGTKRNAAIRKPHSSTASQTRIRSSSIKSKHDHGRTDSNSTAASNSTDEKRSSVVRTRIPSLDSSASNEHVPRTMSPTSPASSAGSPHSVSTGAKTHLSAPPRPAFNTYQQHYSPAKTALPKPPIPAVRPTRVAATPVEEVPPSSDISRQQIELVQLSLLHQASAKAMREFEASAKRKLGKKHARIKKDYRVTRSLEQEHQRLANLAALETWCPDPGLLAENLQLLNRVYLELTSLTEPEGRYAELVAVFEAWIEDTEILFSGARSGFVENLPDVWRTTHTSLALKLRALQREFDALPRAPNNEAEPSSLGVLIRGCQTLLEGMLRELEVMSKLEKGIVEREKARVADEVNALTLNQNAMGGLEDKWMPMWQSVT